MIRKFSLWLNPSQFGKGVPRWDADIFHDDGRIERITGITEAQIIKIVKGLNIQ